jgi:subtilisin-like proprotein convertase family protein
MTKALFFVTMTVLVLARPAQANFIENWNSGFNNGGIVPDGSLTGWSDTRSVAGAVGTITDVNVTLTLSGGWNGDLYAYLVHDSGFAVLLNRVGRTAASPAGFETAGMSVTLDDAAVLGNIHSVTAPAGGYRLDGRNISPLSSGALFDSTSPTALLSSFNTLNASGSWTLFIADVSGGDQSLVTSWGLDIATVPEPASLVEGTVAVLLLGGAIGFYRLRGARTPPEPSPATEPCR